MDFYQLKKEDVFSKLNSSLNGLSEHQVEERLQANGYNEIREKKENKVLKILISQLNSFVVYILFAAVIISIITEQYLDASVIMAILILNTILGFIQEYRAEKSIEALKRLETKRVQVIRNKEQKLIDSRELVPGDIIVIEEGIKIPADSYIIECYEIEADESILTGESVPVKKDMIVINKNVQIAEQHNMLFSAATITKGRGKAIVVNTAMNTEVGKIASLIQKQEDKQTPLQKKLDKVGKRLGITVIVVAVVIFIAGLFDQQNPSDMLLIAISLAVAAVPEGLPAIVTISLALGTKRMVKRNVLIRKLSSVETLGSTTIICVPGNTPIICNDGLKNIESIKEGEKVLGADGNFHNVIKTFRRNYSGEVVNIKPIGLPLIKITPEHPVLVSRFKDHRPLVYIGGNMTRPREREVLEAEWIAAKEINENDLVLMPRIKNEEIFNINFRKGRYREETKLVLDEELAEIFGWYLAEGCTYSNKGSYGIVFYLGKHELDNLKRLKDLIERKLGLKTYIYETQTSISLQFINQDLAVLFKNIFGDNAINKRIPTIILDSPKNIICRFLYGYLKGDGNISDYYIRFTTSSKTLAYQLILILAKLGLRGRLYTEKPRINYIRGRQLIKKESYTIFVSGTQAEVINKVKNPITEEKNNLFLSDKNFVYVPIRYVKIEQESLEVFNIETESNTYALPFIVHNCADKTGTMTQNKMAVTKLYLDNKIIDMDKDSKNLKLMHNIMANCNMAVLPDIGDPTDLGILRAATKATKYPKVGEIPFTSKNKTMITFNKVDKKIFTFSKFAPEKIYDLCSYININGRVTHFTPKLKEDVMKVNDELASNALRVIGYAYAEEKRSKDLIFVGLSGMIDPPKPEVKDALKKCQDAGIKVIMITGDHKLTAQAIAKQIGLGSRVLTGEDLDGMSDEKLKEKARHTDIYARVTPEHKVRILNSLYDYNIVAMTGDGVNDAPALKRAHIGVAVGSGTDVAKEASDMIILDNNFNSIVSAVEEGRGIYDDIKKFINYLLSSNLGEVLIIFLAMLFAFHSNDDKIVIPLTALQLLWINLVTDGLPALALGIDPISSDVMKRKPRNPKENILTKNTIIDIVVIGVLMAIVVLTLFRINLDNVVKAQTIAFTSIVVLEMVRVQMIRSKYKLKIFSNKWLILAIASSFLLQILVVYTPKLNEIFKTTPLLLNDWISIIIGALAMFVVGTLINNIVRKTTKQFD